MNTSSKRGSALLIVLGFLSFMVVSAVAFSVYMRMERVPSSALRRSTVVRHLVKGAMAQAISRLDASLGRDPYPGVVVPSTSLRNSSGDYYNHWFGRVFMPPNKSPGVSSEGRSDAEHRMMPDANETVSVLNLEALGYLPPPLINDVRFNSRRSWAAAWEQFNFDAGRYAFCAVNVSDYFDVNKVKAGTARTSAVDNRVTITSLFTDNNNNLDLADATAFNTFVQDGRGGDLVDYPFVSMMDYNLALGSAGTAGKFQSPFYRIASGLNSGSTYGGFDEMSTWYYASQMFVAGSYSETTNIVGGLDLTRHRSDNLCGQPFPNWVGSTQMEGGRTIMDIISNVNPQFMNKYNSDPLGSSLDLSSLPDSVALYDYLDYDNVPTSLALPTVERTPMITGIGFDTLQFQLTVSPPTTIPAGSPISEGGKWYQVTKNDYRLTHISGGVLNLGVTVAFPFKLTKALNENYQVQAFARIFLSPTLLNARGNNGAALIPSGTASTLKPTLTDWNTPTTTLDMSKANTWISLRSNPVPINLASQTIRTEEDAWKLQDAGADSSGRFHCTFPAITINDSSGAHPFFSEESWKEVVLNPETGLYTPSSAPPEKRYTVKGLYPINATLNGADPRFATQSTPEAAWPKTVVLYPHVAIWVRIIDANGDTVDVVPATMHDDNTFNNVNNSSIAGMFPQVNGNYEPFLMLKSPSTFAFDSATINNLASSGSVTWGDGVGNSFKSMYVADPRWNWVPENWSLSDRLLSGEDWMIVAQTCLNQPGRDGDIFMFVSNQGYLQSMGELAFLARTDDLDNGSRVGPTGKMAGGYTGAIATSTGFEIHRGLFWKTYRPYDISGSAGRFRKFNGIKTTATQRDEGASDELFNMAISDGASKFAVNPYTDSERIISAALANTPYDWWVAGTNINNTANTVSQALKREILDPNNPNRAMEYAFNEYSGKQYDEGLMRYKDDLAKIAAFMKERFRQGFESNPNLTWEEIYDSWNWSGRSPNGLTLDDDPFLGKTAEGGQVSPAFYDSIYDIDRKFLYSYWRSCFANNQQLFLVFVRAESSSLGSSGEGQSPGQLGGRAVALVWRDPADTIGAADENKGASTWNPNRRPHKTRILFYHQFD